MTVRELIDALEELGEHLEVVFEDEYGERLASIGKVSTNQHGQAVLEGE